MRNRLQPRTLVLYAFLGPGIVLFFLCCVAPLFVALFYSVFDWDGGPHKSFVGFENYLALAQDGAFWSAFLNNVRFILWTVIGQIGIAFVVSMLMVSKTLKLGNFHRTVIFFPVILSAVVVGFLWRIIYNKDYGLLNLGLTSAGLSGLIRPWLDDPSIVIASLAIPKIWQYIGYYMVILLASIQSIDKSILESAEVDGAVGWKKSVHVVIPLIRNTLIVTVMLCISGNMKTFDQIFVMTGGGPGNSSQVVAMYAYQVSMERMRYGYGSAVAIGILILSMSLIILSRVIGSNKRGDY
jgi:raffinose/stachyose/melibiose transport system permease protein